MAAATGGGDKYAPAHTIVESVEHPPLSIHQPALWRPIPMPEEWKTVSRLQLSDMQVELTKAAMQSSPAPLNSMWDPPFFEYYKHGLHLVFERLDERRTNHALEIFRGYPAFYLAHMCATFPAFTWNLTQLDVWRAEFPWEAARFDLIKTMYEASKAEGEAAN